MAGGGILVILMNAFSIIDNFGENQAQLRISKRNERKVNNCFA